MPERFRLEPAVFRYELEPATRDALAGFFVIWPEVEEPVVAVDVAAGVDDESEEDLLSLPQAATSIAASAAVRNSVSDLMGRSGSSCW